MADREGRNETGAQHDRARDAQDAAALVLHIEGGFYAGIVHRCPTSSVTVGADAEADVALVAEPLEPIHVAIEPGAEGLAIEARGPGVHVAGRTLGKGEAAGPLVADLAVDERLESLDPAHPIELSIGEVTIRVVPREARRAARSRMLVDMPAPPVACEDDRSLARLGVLLLPAFAATVYLLLPERAPAPSPRSEPVLVEMPVTPDPSAVEGAMAELRTRLDERALGAIGLRREGDALIASGDLPAEDYERWRGLQTWFDGMYGDVATLVAEVDMREEEPMDPPRVDAVWTGTDPHVVSRGAKYAVGMRMPDGWTPTEIAGDHVMLERDGRVVRVEM